MPSSHRSSADNLVSPSLLQIGRTRASGSPVSACSERDFFLFRRKQRMESLSVLTKGWVCLNTMRILLLHLQKARVQERPNIAVILLQLDLMGDPLECSIYREEAIDATVKALDCRVQEQIARALLILGGHFSYTGEPEVEKWLLRKAGFDENNEISCYGTDFDIYGFLLHFLF